MLSWIRSLLVDKPFTPDELYTAVACKEAITGRSFFNAGQCPYAKYVKSHGVPTRLFHDTRIDN